MMRRVLRFRDFEIARFVNGDAIAKITCGRFKFTRGESEVQSALVGEKLMEALKAVDPVAYIRFASVYRSFLDVESFPAKLADLLSE